MVMAITWQSLTLATITEIIIKATTTATKNNTTNNNGNGSQSGNSGNGNGNFGGMTGGDGNDDDNDGRPYYDSRHNNEAAEAAIANAFKKLFGWMR